VKKQSFTLLIRLAAKANKANFDKKGPIRGDEDE
jgi:hypothetical protein